MPLNYLLRTAQAFFPARWALFALGLVLLAANSGRAVVLSQQQQPPAPPRLVVKVFGYAVRDGWSFPVRERLSERDGAIMGRLKKDSAPVPDAQGKFPEQIFLKFTAVHEGNAVRVRVVVLPVSPRHEDYVPGKDEREIVNQVVTEDADITLQELTALGLDPIRLKIEPYQPLPTERVLPQVVNDLPALEVAAWEAVKRGPNIFHRLKLRNLSEGNIVALQIFARYGNSGSGEGYTGTPLIKAGGFYELETTLWSESPYQPSRVQEGVARKLLIKAILFDDWTYQGDLETAVDLAGGRMGENVQKARVIAILDKALNAPPQADDVLLAELEQQFAALPVEPDASLLAELVARFPEGKESKNRDLFPNALKSGLRGVQQVLLEYELRDIKRERNQNPQQFNLRESLLRLKTELGQPNQ